MASPGVVIPKGVSATSNSATIALECRNATSFSAGCSKTFGGECGAATNVTVYPGEAGRCVVDVANLEPRTRYDISACASNDVSSSPYSNFTFSTRSAPKI